MLPKEQNLKQMNAMYDANPRILEDVHRAVQGGKEESWIFRGWRHWKKTRCLVKSCSTAYGHPFDNILKEIAGGYNVIPRVNRSLFH